VKDPEIGCVTINATRNVPTPTMAINQIQRVHTINLQPWKNRGKKVMKLD